MKGTTKDAPYHSAGRIGLISDTHGLLFVNPGSAGPRRFKLPVAIGELLIEGTSVSARVVDCE